MHAFSFTSKSFITLLSLWHVYITCTISYCVRLESVKLKELRSEAKVIGTLVTFGGALLMTLYKGPQINLINNPNSTQKHESHSLEGDKHWFTGTLFLCFGCFAWSSFYILQVIKNNYTCIYSVM